MAGTVSEKRWWETWWGQSVILIATGVIAILIAWEVTRHYDKPTPPTTVVPTKQPEPQAMQPQAKPEESVTTNQAPHRGANTQKDRIDQHGTGNGAVGGNITTGPCSNVLVGGNGNQASVNCDTPRRLSQQQIAAIKSSGQTICATLPLINVTTSNGNQEAQRYAYDLIEALRGGGCKADLTLPTPGLTPDVSGIHVAVRDYNNIDSSAKELGKILSGAGVSFSFNPMKPDFLPAEVFVLVIGAKE
jgi:hypothetical protein